MIIVEGGDLVGKTTLVAAIAKEMARRNVAMMPRHFTKPPECFDYFWGYNECVSKHALIDRLHMSQLVYRVMDGGKLRLTPHRYALVDAAIERVGGIVVVMTRPEDALREKYAQLRQESAAGSEGISTSSPFAMTKKMLKLDDVLKVNQLFTKIINEAGLMTHLGFVKPKIDINICGDFVPSGFAENASMICDIWQERQREHAEVLSGAALAGRISL